MRLLTVVLPLFAISCGSPQRTVHTASYPSGQPRWQVEMQGGVPDGRSTTFRRDGQVASQGSFHQGQKHGTFRYWDARGQVTRVEQFRDGALVSANPAPGEAAPGEPIAPPGVTARAANAPAPPATDRYTELQLGLGVGASTAARTSESSDPEALASLGFTLLVRRGNRLVGATLHGGGELFGPSHTYVGALIGWASRGPLAHVEILAEGGTHTISNLGDDLFSEAVGNTSATLPYLGAQGRLVLDPGDTNGFVFQLGVGHRVDLLGTSRTVTQMTCFFGCSTDRQEWTLGGTSTEVAAGLSYQFN